MNPCDVLLLDEPTNHLDNEMVTWLEDFLRSFKGVVIMVTHDRYFLDRVTNKILEISHGGLYAYEANYSKFLELKAEREEMELASERKRQSVLRMELEWERKRSNFTISARVLVRRRSWMILIILCCAISALGLLVLMGAESQHSSRLLMG